MQSLIKHLFYHHLYLKYLNNNYFLKYYTYQIAYTSLSKCKIQIENTQNIESYMNQEIKTEVCIQRVNSNSN